MRTNLCPLISGAIVVEAGRERSLDPEVGNGRNQDLEAETGRSRDPEAGKESDGSGRAHVPGQDTGTGLGAGAGAGAGAGRCPSP